jgi:predicted Zn finger-like uncharacterized protein
MDVQCERCRTEYEFDDALVSGRGTTVKCTNCGHQFKIRPASAGAGLEQWSVRTAAGQGLVFTSLRELQKAIANGQVGRGDSLSRGNAPPRPLGSIAELEPFFNDRAAARGGAGGISREGSSAAPGAGAARVPAQVAPPTVPVIPALAPPARARSNTLRPEESAAVPPPPGAQLSNLRDESVPPRQVAAYPASYQDAGPARAPAPPLVPMASSPLPPPTNASHRPYPSNENDFDARGRAAFPSMPPDDSEIVYAVPRRRRVGGWIVAVIVVGGACVIAYFAFRPYLGVIKRGSAAPVALDARALQFLTDGERGLSEGNLETAKEGFDKASALADKDPHVLLDVARLAAVRADIQWLRMRLLPPDAADEIATTKVSLDDLATAARKASDEALTAAPEDPAAVRAKVDALRILGERDTARSYVAKIISSASQPETAYVLAALDLAELDPLWPTVIDRLRVAAAGEGNSGRARAALVYALARAGDAAGAKAELDKLASLAHPHPLLGALRTFVTRGQPKAPVDAGGPAPAKPAAASGAVEVNSLPAAVAASGMSSDPRVLLEQAEAAKNRGDHDRAKMLYEASLAKSPRDSQALSGLGDVSRAQHDSGSAKGFYQRALASNPNYLPALVGLGDVEWEEGDQPRAQKAYKDIVDRFPEGTYPVRVKQRAEASAPTPAATPETKPETKPGASSPLTLPANTPSDLPGTTP